MVIKTIWSFGLEGVVGSKGSRHPRSCCSESLPWVWSVPGDRSAGLWEQMCKESQRPLHSLKNLWPCWSLGAAGPGLLSHESTFSTTSLGRGVAETSFRRLSPGRAIRARVLWLIQPWEHPSYEEQWGQTWGETTSPENAEGHGSRLTHPLTLTARTRSPGSSGRENFVPTRMWPSQESINVKPKFLVHKILQVLTRSQAFTFSSERTRKE